MTRRLYLTLFAGLLLAGGIASVLLAAPDQEIYAVLGEDLVQIRGGALDGDDSSSVTAPLVVSGTTKSVFLTRGDPTVMVSARLSVSGAQVGTEIHLWRQKTSTTFSYVGMASVTTATGGRNVDLNGEFVAPMIYADTSGATHYEVRKTDPTLGTVRYFVMTCRRLERGGRRGQRRLGVGRRRR